MAKKLYELAVILLPSIYESWQTIPRPTDRSISGVADECHRQAQSVLIELGYEIEG